MSSSYKLAVATLTEENLRLEAQLVRALQSAESYRRLVLQAVAYAYRLRTSLDDGRRRHIIRDRDAQEAA